jgi:hypothetical protein
MCLLAILVTAVLLASAVMPITAYAQDPLPPPADEAAAAEAPITDDAAAEGAPAAEPPPAEEIALPKILAEVPAGTDVVLLDENGAPLPLATNEAAEVLENGDPMWCPGTAEPGDSGCTTPHASFADLLADLADDSETGSGTITSPIQYSVTDDGADPRGIFFQLGDRGHRPVTRALTSTATAERHAHRTQMNFINWEPGNTLTLNDLDARQRRHAQSMTASWMAPMRTDHRERPRTSSNSDGASIETTGDITVSHSEFQGSSSDGLDLFAGGDIELDEVDSSYAQGGDGVYGFANGSFTITHGVFSNNYENGITGRGEDLTLSDVTADSNGTMGILAGAYGDALLTNVTATENYLLGIAVGGMGDTTINSLFADDNGLLGVAAGQWRRLPRMSAPTVMNSSARSDRPRGRR